MSAREPRTVRDLRLAYETTNKIDGNIEFQVLSNEVEEGAMADISLRVTPSTWSDNVNVSVVRTQYTNVRKSEYGGHSYTPRRIIDWERDYTFEEFRESPFWQMTLDEWGKFWATGWDTSKMDEHEVGDEDTRWWMWCHVYRHKYDWLRNWEKTGDIDEVNVQVDEDGNVEMHLNRECFFSGDVWRLRRIIKEHEEMTETLARLNEHGVDVDGGVLRIKLWEG